MEHERAAQSVFDDLDYEIRMQLADDDASPDTDSEITTMLRQAGVPEQDLGVAFDTLIELARC